MTALTQTRVVLRAGAGAEPTTIKLALEARHTAATSIITGEAEVGRRAAAWIGWVRGDCGIRRRCINAPGEASRSAVRVARRIYGPYLERMRTVSQAREVLWAGAGGKSAAIELALEARHTAAAGITAGEAEAGIRAITRIGWVGRNRRAWRNRINHPGVAGRCTVSIARRIHGAYLERVRTVRQARVVLRAGTRAEPAAIELALKARDARTAAIVAGEAETGAGVVAGIGRVPGDGRVRCGGIHNPSIARRRRVRIACRVHRAHLERVRAVAQARVGLWAGASNESASINFTFKTCDTAAAGIAAGEAETGIRAGTRIGRICRDCRIRHNGINDPGV